MTETPSIVRCARNRLLPAAGGPIPTRRRFISITALERARASIACLLLTLLMLLVPAVLQSSLAMAAAAEGDAALVIGNRTIHVFRGALGAFSAAERAEAARQRISRALDSTGEGWSSLKTTEQGVLVMLDGQPMFAVAPVDVRTLAGETPEDLANQASRLLQKIWSEAREQRDPRRLALAAAKVAMGTLLLAIALAVVIRITRALRTAVSVRLAHRLHAMPVAGAGSRIASLFLTIAERSCVLLAWLLSLLALFAFITYSLKQFVLTRPMGEGLLHTLTSGLEQILQSVAHAIPGLIIAVIIFLAAWLATQISTELFNQVAAGRAKLGMLDSHTAPATRRIANASLWLFALAMAYPYLPGAQTEAFKGLSVILGLMVSIGASGLVGQIASGIIMVYTRALLLGEYVRIQDCEGTVTELGLFVTRLRTGTGEEIALPNALVLANVTRNYSRVMHGTGFNLDTTVTIGYDTPWRQVHAMLLEAARATPGVADEPAPFVVQTALSDFYVNYKLVVYAGADKPMARARVASDLNAAIQDVFNKHQVQIMSPHYYTDPDTVKIVPEAAWYTPPAAPPREPR